MEPGKGSNFWFRPSFLIKAGCLCCVSICMCGIAVWSRIYFSPGPVFVFALWRRRAPAQRLPIVLLYIDEACYDLSPKGCPPRAQLYHSTCQFAYTLLIAFRLLVQLFSSLPCPLCLFCLVCLLLFHVHPAPLSMLIYRWSCHQKTAGLESGGGRGLV